MTEKEVLTVIEQIASDRRRTKLNLARAGLKKLPPEICKLTHLRNLSLYDNQLTSLPAEIGKLTNLRRLVLSRNNLTSLPPEIGNLTKLRELKVAVNKLTSIPREIGNLTRLGVLSFSQNQLSSIPPEIGNLNSLYILDLWANQLTSLPVELGKIKYLWRVHIGDNPLKSPPIEIAQQGMEAIKEYFESLEGEKQALNEVKVLLVGDGGAGKTSLVKQLIGAQFDENESQTHGINIRDWEVQKNGKNIDIHFWDFGGQEIMHATHQFFLSKRSLYILVLDGRKEEDAEYWLKHIESFGGDSPIIVVLNKMDENPGFEVNRRFLQDKYKGIRGFYRISCKKGKGIAGLSERLIEESTKVEILETTWAKSWFNVKTQLENMTEDFISYDKYKEICENEEISKKAAQDTLVDFLNDLGVILHFKDFKLLDTHVLEPKWVTQAVYKIINSEKLAENKGILELDLLDQILKRERKEDFHYPPDRYQYIIELMKKFELCYEIDDEMVLIPDLLEVPEPEIDFNYDNCLRFLIEYDFLPKSVVPRFIVKMHKDIKSQLRWRTGVVLEDEDFVSTAIIRADESAKKIYIYVRGELRRDYFSVIRHAFLYINKSFEKLKFVEKVPMPDEPSITVSYEHLTRLEKMGKENYIPDGSEKEYNVKDLLGTIYVEKKTKDEILRLLRKLKDASDSQETLLKKANDIVLLQPNFFGLGANLNALIKKLFPKDKK